MIYWVGTMVNRYSAVWSNLAVQFGRLVVYFRPSRFDRMGQTRFDLSFIKKIYFQDILDEFDALAELDPKRKCYYSDMRSKQILELQLKNSTKLDLNLSNRALTCLYFKEQFLAVKNVDLSKNKLKSVESLLPYLKSCKQLNLDDNLIENIQGFEANSSVEKVSVRRTPLAENLTAVQNLQAKFPSVEIIFE